mmetsp:Transcript_40389/g.95682  ORF Transcript_40389/g.95682 Transcript_40389/m.95682 type:complete len:208 (-) Transcript_40389:821-1444(-)
MGKANGGGRREPPVPCVRNARDIPTGVFPKDRMRPLLLREQHEEGGHPALRQVPHGRSGPRHPRARGLRVLLVGGSGRGGALSDPGDGQETPDKCGGDVRTAGLARRARGHRRGGRPRAKDVGGRREGTRGARFPLGPVRDVSQLPARVRARGATPPLHPTVPGRRLDRSWTRERGLVGARAHPVPPGLRAIPVPRRHASRKRETDA